MWSQTGSSRIALRMPALLGWVRRRLRPTRTIAVLAGLLVSLTVAAQQPVKVEVFTLSTIVMTNTPGATIYYVDGISQIQHWLSAGLPKDPAAAQIIVKERWSTLGRAGNERLQNAGVGLGRVVEVQEGIHAEPDQDLVPSLPQSVVSQHLGCHQPGVMFEHARSHPTGDLQESRPRALSDVEELRGAESLAVGLRLLAG